MQVVALQLGGVTWLSRGMKSGAGVGAIVTSQSLGSAARPVLQSALPQCPSPAKAEVTHRCWCRRDVAVLSPVLCG